MRIADRLNPMIVGLAAAVVLAGVIGLFVLKGPRSSHGLGSGRP